MSLDPFLTRDLHRDEESRGWEADDVIVVTAREKPIAAPKSRYYTPDSLILAGYF
jgi:hypothetical protein